MIGPTLVTQRLVLRPPTAEDFPHFCEFMADPMTHFIGGPLAPELAWRSWAAIAGAWTVNGHSMFSVLERDSERWLGRIGPWTPLGWPGNEVGWGLIRDAQGRGYAVEAATACIDWSFDHLGWDDVVHTIAPDNTASQAVARRLGAVNRGKGRLPAPIEHFEVDVWGQTKAEWKARAR